MSGRKLAGVCKLATSGFLSVTGPDPVLDCGKSCCENAQSGVPEKRATMEQQYIKPPTGFGNTEGYPAVHCLDGDPPIAPGVRLTLFFGDKQNQTAIGDGKKTRLLADGVSSYRAIAAKTKHGYFGGETSSFSYTMPERAGKKKNKDEVHAALIVKPFRDKYQHVEGKMYNPFAAPYQHVPINAVLDLSHTKSDSTLMEHALITTAYEIGGAFGSCNLGELKLKVHLPHIRPQDSKAPVIGGQRQPTAKRTFDKVEVLPKLVGQLLLFPPGNTTDSFGIETAFEKIVKQLDVLTPTASEGFINGQRDAIRAIKATLCKVSETYKLYQSIVEVQTDKQLYVEQGVQLPKADEKTAAHHLLQKLVVSVSFLAIHQSMHR